MGHGDSAEQSVHQLFAAHAAETPEAVAVVDGPTRLTYRELDERAEAVARLLAPARPTATPSDPGGQAGSAGTAEVVIAVRLPRSAALVTALLATLKSGAAYLPLDPGLPAERTRRLLESAGARLLVTDSRLLPGPSLGGPDADAVPVFDLADVRPARPADGARHPLPTVSPHALAYLIHTSGSTGRPKPVAVEHHSLAHHALAARDRFRLTADDRVLQFTNPGFDVLAEEVFPTLAAGGRVVVLPDTSVSPLELEQFIRENGVTVANLPTPYWDQWGADLDLGPRELPPTLRLLVVGSDTTYTRSLAAWHRHSRIPVINAYGLTETTITATTGRYPAEAGLPDTATLPIGAPLGSTEVRVLDAATRPCPTGEAGELYVGGAAPARGYHGLPGLTAQRFVPDPFTDRPGARLYRTGDLVRQLDDGSLEFLGRGDQQVKIRGHRVEPAEVEAVLAELDGVRQCVVVPSGTGPETVLIAYVVGDTDRAALRERAGQVLPVYQVPADFVLLDALPVTAQGKVDRRALPAPDAGSREESGRSEPPRGPIEERVAAMWSEVLDGPAIGRNDDFRTLGGNSLDVVRILGRLRHNFGVPLTTREFLRAATVAGLAALLRDGGPRDGGAEAVVAPLPAVSTTPVAPGIVSTHEQRLWFLDQLHRGAGIAYNVPVALRLRGELDLSALRSAYQETVDRHPRLRTSFVSLDGRITAEAAESAPGDLPLVDLSHRPDAEAAALARAERLAGEHIDLGRAPLVRAELTRVAVDDHLLTVVFHHLVADGLSVDVFDRDLAAAYAARRTGADPRPPTGSLGYDHFAQWQRDVAESPAADAALAYWRTGLSGAPFVLDLPTDHPRPAVMSYRGRRFTRAAPTGLLHGVRTLARVEDTTPYCVVLTAVGAVLSEECGQPELLVASPTAGRPHPELDDVVGFFVNTVILRLRRTDGTTFRGWLGEVRETALDAFEHEYVAFDRLTAEFAPSRDLSRPPLVQFALAYQGERRPQARLAGLDATPVPLDNGTAKFDLTLEVEEVHGELVLTAEYSSDLFEPGTVERILDRVTACLTAAVAAPDAVLPALDAPASDRNAPHGTGVHGVLGGVVARCGGRVAVGDGVRELSYGELDRLSSVVAARLVAAGAGRGVLVALVGERDVDLVVGMVAVLKSGAGYVPLDPGFPVERLRETVADAGCRVVLGKRGWAGVLDGAGGVAFVGLDDPVGAVEVAAAARWVGARVVEGDTAYVIYTSGSTGRPKGVVVTHGNVLALFAACGEAFGGWGGDEVWSMFHSAAFDFSVWEVFGALLQGGRLRVVPYAVTRDPAAMWELVCREGVTVLSQTPTAFTQLVAAAAAQGFPATALRTVVFGGEALRPGSLKAWSAAYGWRGPRLVNMYGITETTVHVTYRPLAAADQEQAVSPIGTPLPGLTITLHPHTSTSTDPSGTAADGTGAGDGGGLEGAEMFVSGPQVAAGYLGRPALTAQRFLPDPDGPPGSRRYRTGDLATTGDHPTTTHNPGDLTTPNPGSPGSTGSTGSTSTVITADHGSELHYLGRTDHQIKLRGFRIEPAEIERVLLTHPAVHAATVILNPHTPHHPQLAAYTVLTTPHHHTETTLTDLRTHLTTHLPTHMIPTTLTPLPALPTTPNGKLDPTRLPPPTTTTQHPTHEGHLVALGDASGERALRAVWAAVLGVPEHRIGPDDNYFALGGDSITALRLIAEARTAGVPLSLEQLFLHPTIGELAAAMADIEDPRAAGPAEGASATGAASTGVLAELDPALVPEGVEAAYPLADLQLGILYHVELSDDSRLYRDLTSVRVTSDWDEAALRGALDVLCGRHEILRTSFDLAEFDEPMQLVHRVATVPLEVEEAFGVLDERAQEVRLRAWWDRESATAFDLDAPPLLRAHVVRWSADTFQLSLSVHHVLLDGWSFARFTTELLVEYDSRLGSGGGALERMPQIRYRDFVAAEQRLRESREARTFWRDLLAGAEPLSVPEADRDDGDDGDDRGQDPATRLLLPAELTAGARRVADELGVPVKSVYLAAHLWALGTWRGVTDVVSGLCGNGRPETEGADLLLGLFLNVLPVRIGIATGTWADLVRAVFDAERQHLPFRAYPLARIQREFGRPPFAVMFNYTDFHASDALHGLRHVTVDGWRYEDRTNFPVLVEVNRLQDGEGVELSVRVDPDETSPAGEARVAELFVEALTALTGDVKRPVPKPS